MTLQIIILARPKTVEPDSCAKFVFLSIKGDSIQSKKVIKVKRKAIGAASNETDSPPSIPRKSPRIRSKKN